MTSSAKAELEAIKREISSIISSLNDVAYGVRNDFCGIGNERCADSIQSVINKYTYVKRTLDGIDTTEIEAAEAMQSGINGGESGSSWGCGSSRRF